TSCSGACTNTSIDPTNCGACGTVCSLPNATEFCLTGRCGVAACDTGFGDCNATASDGCEVNLTNTLSNCGRCGNVCPTAANATTTCASGVCGFTCNTNFGDCNGVASDGCEVDLRTNSSNCGACGTSCGAGVPCSAGRCQFGTGSDGPLTAGGTINNVRAAASGASGSMTLAIASVSGTFLAGRQVIVHQTQGAGAGTYQRAVIASATGSALTLTAPLAASFTSGAQVVMVQEYTTVNLPSGATLTAPAWDGTTGGILAFDSSDATINGTITMSARGFRGRNHGCFYRCGRGFQGESASGLGGVTIAANGAGGGGGGQGQDDACGGGGGYGAAGSNGGNGGCGACAEACPIPGGAAGGATGAANLGTSLFFGGAGGEGGADEDGGNPGRGGNGGGIVLLRVTTLTVGSSALISSDGEAGSPGNQGACGGGGCGMGGGGGGAGGAVRIVVLTAASVNTNRITALGAGGGSPTCGSTIGGTGGVGRIGINAPTFTGSTNPARDTN
ncbi:MAG: hypothetical protein U0326_39420, partial [Polyangiales bacterium]